MKINEVFVQTTQQLSQIQKLTLLKIYVAGSSPENSADSMKGDPQALSAGEYLMKYNMIQAVPNGVVITQLGTQLLQQNGLLDNNGVTQMGQQLIDQS